MNMIMRSFSFANSRQKNNVRMQLPSYKNIQIFGKSSFRPLPRFFNSIKDAGIARKIIEDSLYIKVHFQVKYFPGYISMKSSHANAKICPLCPFVLPTFLFIFCNFCNACIGNAIKGNIVCSTKVSMLGFIQGKQNQPYPMANRTCKY